MKSMIGEFYNSDKEKYGKEYVDFMYDLRNIWKCDECPEKNECPKIWACKIQTHADLWEHEIHEPMIPQK